MSRFQRLPKGPLVSEPERAVLEMLSDVGVRQPLQEARDLLEAAPSLRAAVLQELLARCTRVKTVRLCLTLGRELGHRWATKLDPKALPTGSRRAWVGRSGDGGQVSRIHACRRRCLHNRPFHEVLFATPKDIRLEFEGTFVGMTTEPVSLDVLLETRSRLFQELLAALDANERQFLRTLARTNPAKLRTMSDALDQRLQALP